MQSKIEQLDSLFDKWEQTVSEYKGIFVRDGIINEILYKDASPKILFVTKEPNNPKQTKGNYREWWGDGVKSPFSYRIAEWGYGILNDFPEYDEVWKEKWIHKAIQQIAFINIKKSGGTGNPNYNVICDHLNKNLNFLHRQIKIIDPDIIITGFINWKEFRKKLFQDISWQKSGYNVDIGRYNKVKVIDYSSPGSCPHEPALPLVSVPTNQFIN